MLACVTMCQFVHLNTFSRRDKELSIKHKLDDQLFQLILLLICKYLLVSVKVNFGRSEYVSLVCGSLWRCLFLQSGIFETKRLICSLRNQSIMKISCRLTLWVHEGVNEQQVKQMKTPVGIRKNSPFLSSPSS